MRQTPTRIRSQRPAPRFCATKVVSARPNEASGATATWSTRMAEVKAATASEPSPLMAYCNTTAPIAITDIWKPIARPGRSDSPSSPGREAQSARVRWSCGIRTLTRMRHSTTDTACANTVASAAPGTPQPSPPMNATTRTTFSTQLITRK
nr:hypothetical protein [Tessaracoccus coleopterorum]